MKRGTAPDHFKNPSQAFRHLDQQRAGRRTDEYLTPAQPGARSSSGKSATFSRVRDKEGKIAMHAMTAALHLVGEGLRVDVNGSVFGISNTAVTPPITALREPVSRSSL